MKHGRIQMIVVPRNVSGRIRTFHVRPSLIGALFFLVLICIGAVPFLEQGLISLVQEIYHLEMTREVLETEISKLNYVRGALSRLENKEAMLRDYFGMAAYPKLEEVIGIGGDRGIVEKSAAEAGIARVSDKEAHLSKLHDKIETLASNYDVLNHLAAKQREVWNYTPSIIPVNFTNPRISSGFGWRKNPFTNRREFHAGIDIIGPKGTTIISPASGVVLTVGYDQWLGNYLVVGHGGGVKTIYGHLKEISVKEGMQVERGVTMGVMGNTGLSTSRHLHYGVVKNGRAIDPMQYILDMKG